jgi:hypothetical protein
MMVDVHQQGERMVKSFLIVLLAVGLLAAPVFGERGDPPPSSEPKGPPTFVEEAVPSGKAIVYVYHTFGGLLPKDWGNLLVLQRSGLPTVLRPPGYFSLVADPGPVELWFVLASGGQYGSGLLARKFIVEAAAGEATFVTLGFGPEVKVIPPEKARKDDGILYCKKVE